MFTWRDKFFRPDFFLVSILLFFFSGLYIALFLRFEIKFPILKPAVITVTDTIKISKIRPNRNGAEYMRFDYLGKSYWAPCLFEYPDAHHPDVCGRYEGIDKAIDDPDITIKNMSFIQSYSTGTKWVNIKNGVFVVKGKEFAFYSDPEQIESDLKMDHFSMRLLITTFFICPIYGIAYVVNFHREQNAFRRKFYRK